MKTCRNFAVLTDTQTYATQNSNLCVWLCPRALSCLLQKPLQPSRRHFWSGQILVWQNATTCLSLRQKHSSADGVSMLAPTMWNALPSQLHSSSISRGQFRAGLKTHLFTQTYGHLWELLLKSVLFYITYALAWKYEEYKMKNLHPADPVL